MIHRILNNGISVNNTVSLNRKLRVSNLITLIIAVVMLGYTPMYILFDQPTGIILNSTYFTCSIVTFLLIHQKKTIPAFFLLFFASTLYFVASSIIYGTKVNLHFFLLIACILQVVLFNSQVIIKTFIGLCIVSFFSVVIWSHFYDRLIYIPQQTESAETIMGNVNLLLLFLIISLFILFFKGEMIAGQKRILEQKI